MSDPVGPSPLPEWRVTYVQYPAVIWARYATAIGLDNLHNWFGDNWPRDTVPGERVYSIRNPEISSRPFDPLDHPAAWLSLTRDQFDPTNYYMSRGVWPGYHGCSLGKI